MSHCSALKFVFWPAICLFGATGSAYAQCGEGPGFYSCANEWSGGAVTNLGGLSGSQINYAYGINNAGEVVGITNINTGYAVEWTNGSVAQLPFLPGSGFSNAFGINNVGQVVGQSVVAIGTAATEWSGGTAINLGGLPSTRFNAASAINDMGQIVGESTSGGTVGVPLVQLAEEWSNGSVTELPPLPGYADSTAFAINIEGLVVGTSFNFGGSATATEWVDGVPVNLRGLPGYMDSSAHGINDSGQVVGNVTLGGSEYAVEWSAGGVITLLGPGTAVAINNAGEAVGQSCNGNDCHAVQWIDGVATILADLPPGSSSAAFALNDKGQVVGSSEIPVPPVPEPATWAMMLLGFAGLGFAGYLSIRRRDAVGL